MARKTYELVRVAHVDPETGEVIRVGVMQKDPDTGKIPELDRRRADGRLFADLARHRADFDLPAPTSDLEPIAHELAADERCGPRWKVLPAPVERFGRLERFEHPAQAELDAQEADRVVQIEAQREYERAVGAGEIEAPVTPSTIEEIVEARVAEEIARRVADGTIDRMVTAEVARRGV